MRQIFAMALITFRESFRSKAMLIPLLFGLAILASTPFTPAFNNVDRIRIMLSVASSAITLLSALAAIFISVTTITNEIKDRRIFTVLSRSTGRFQYVAGKLLGVWAAIAALLLALGVITYGIMIASSSFMLDEQQRESVLAANRLEHTQDVDYLMRDSIIARYEARVEDYERVLELASRFYAEGVIPNGTTFDDLIALLELTDKEIRLQFGIATPQVLKARYAEVLEILTGENFGTDGRLWREWYTAHPDFGRKPRNPDKTREVVSGGEDHRFTWHFDGLREADLEKGLRFQLTAAVVPNPTAALSIVRTDKSDKKATCDIELSWEGGKVKRERVELLHTRASYFTFADEHPPAGTPFDVTIRVHPGPSSIIVGRSVCEVLLESGTFAMNLLRSLLLSWSIAALVSSVGIFATCFVSFPVALLLCIFVLFWGSTAGYLKDLTRQPKNPLFVRTVSQG
ncbi:MAG: hypothetical protein U5N86_12745 [Planctomycetota bacterium]|nr:hypothetical protein [Planctomycetota bacterium]